MIAAAIREGRLAPETKLPTHPALAQQFSVAIATATWAYGELERRGCIVGEAGRGMFVRDPALPLTLGVQQTDADRFVDLVFNMPGAVEDAEVLRRVTAACDLEAMLRYQPHGGRTHERRSLAESLLPRLGAIDPDRPLVTSGGQHGLASIALGVLQRGEAIATDTLTYPGFKSVAALQGLNLVPVEGWGGVMDPDDLDRQCRATRLRGVYLMPTVHNPLGAVMYKPTRLRLIEIAHKHDLLIIEDAADAFLEPAPPPSLVALAPERTIHVGSFSKSLGTGLRLGYLIAPPTQTGGLLEAIRATTWNAPALISAMVTGWVADGTLSRAEETRRRHGAERQKICRSALGEAAILSHCNTGFATTLAIPQALRLAFGGIGTEDLSAIFQTVREAV
jgi:DNA-binding transcriptional MocR family regulator